MRHARMVLAALTAMLLVVALNSTPVAANTFDKVLKVQKTTDTAVVLVVVIDKTTASEAMVLTFDEAKAANINKRTDGNTVFKGAQLTTAEGLGLVFAIYTPAHGATNHGSGVTPVLSAAIGFLTT